MTPDEKRQLEDDLRVLSIAALTPEDEELPDDIDEAYERAAFRFGMDGRGAL